MAWQTVNTLAEEWDSGEWIQQGRGEQKTAGLVFL